MKFLKFFVILVVFIGVYDLLAWTIAFYSHDHHLARMASYDVMTAGIMNTWVHVFLIALNIMAIVALSRIAWSQYLKAVLIGFYIFFILFGTWSLM